MRSFVLRFFFRLNNRPTGRNRRFLQSVHKHLHHWQHWWLYEQHRILLRYEIAIVFQLLRQLLRSPDARGMDVLRFRVNCVCSFTRVIQPTPVMLDL